MKCTSAERGDGAPVGEADVTHPVEIVKMILKWVPTDPLLYQIGALETKIGPCGPELILAQGFC